MKLRIPLVPVWTFEQKGEVDGIPQTEVTLSYKGTTHVLGTHQGNCFLIEESNWQLLPDEETGVMCYWAGGGTELGIFTRKLKMTQNAEPPVFTSTLPKPEACASVADGSVGGGNSYFFDAYEYAEYVGGFLRVHLRLKTPYNDGRPFRSAISTGDENCFISSGAFSPVSTSITQRVRYFSFRMTSDTHWQLWDDEADEALTCATCEGELPPGAKYVRWFGSVDAGASTISTTPFAPTESVELDPVIVVPGILGSMQKDGV
jgi:hypothetical protein